MNNEIIFLFHKIQEKTLVNKSYLFLVSYLDDIIKNYQRQGTENRSQASGTSTHPFTGRTVICITGIINLSN
jgi:hypothetical protein